MEAQVDVVHERPVGRGEDLLEHGVDAQRLGRAGVRQADLGAVDGDAPRVGRDHAGQRLDEGRFA